MWREKWMVIWIMNVLFYTSWWHAGVCGNGGPATRLECSNAGNCIYSNVELIKPNQTLSGTSIVKQPPKNKDDLAIHSVAFIKSTLTHVPVEVFDHYPNLRSMDLTYCGIHQLPDTIMNATRVQRLQLSHNNVTRLSAVRGLTALTHLEMSYNQINRIDGDAFAAMQTLKILDLSFNEIAYISNETFHALTALETLMMDHNRVDRLESEWFRKTTKILFVSFTHNLISEIHHEAFNGLDDLFHLKLTGNKLGRIELRHIDVQNLDIDNNEIRSILVTRQVKILRLDAQSNLITKVRCDTNPRLMGLILTNNSITELGCISKMRRLEMLYLGQNRLKSLDRKAFMALINLVTLSLENNEIESLAADMFKQNLGLRTLILSNNRLKHFNFNIFASINAVDVIHLNGNNLTSIVVFTDAHDHHPHTAETATLADTIQRTVPRLRVVDLSDNDWHCSYLAALLHALEMAKVKCLITTELHVNEINVKGIRCRDDEGQSNVDERALISAAPSLMVSADKDVVRELSRKIAELEVDVTNTRQSNEEIMKKLTSIEMRMDAVEKQRRKEEF